MKFAEAQNLEIINCDYKKLREKREAIVKENNKVASFNKRIKRNSVVTFMLVSVLLAIVTTFVVYLAWEILLPDIGHSAFVQKYNLNPLWVKLSVEIGVILTFLFFVRVIYGSIAAKAEKQKKTKVIMSDAVLFASASEDRTIGNLIISRYENVPYVGQCVRISFDALNKTETECYSFTSLEHWGIILLPFLFDKTIIDVENRTIYKHYEQDGEANTLEEHLIQEMMRHNTSRNQFGKLLEQKDQEIQAFAQKLALSERKNEILVNEVNEANAEKEKAEENLRSAQRSLDDASKLLVDERQKSMNNQNEVDEQVKALTEALESEKKKVVELSAEIEEKNKKITKKEKLIESIQKTSREMHDVLESERAKHKEENAEAAQKLELMQQTAKTEYEKMYLSLTQKIEDGEKEKENMKKEFAVSSETRVREAVAATNEENDALRTDNAELRNQINKDAENYEKRIAEVTAANKKLTSDNASLTNTANQLRKQNESLREKCGSYQKAYEDATHIAQLSNAKCAEMSEQLEEARKLAESDIRANDESKKELEKAQAANEALIQEVASIGKERDRLTDELAATQDEIKAHKHTISSLENELKKEKAANEDVAQKLAASGKEREQLITELSAAGKEQEKLTSELTAAQAKINTHQNTINSLKGNIEKEKREREELNQRLASSDKDRERLASELDIANEEQRRLTSDLTSAQKKVNIQQETISYLEGKLKKAQKEIDDKDENLINAIKAAREKALAESEENKKRLEEEAKLERILKEREERNRKAREDAMRAAVQNQSKN